MEDINARKKIEEEKNTCLNWENSLENWQFNFRFFMANQ